jgi:HlyD family secretion protein
MGTGDDYGAVRCYVDEILIAKLSNVEGLEATMYIRGTDFQIPLEFVRVQPLVSPKIQLSNQRTERVDLRVLPIIFRFKKPANIPIYPGQLVDVYMRAPQTTAWRGSSSTPVAFGMSPLMLGSRCLIGAGVS